jgi:2-polyprenyl-3-methyl-5-hydroxy-6-metoxy-1,4-benzoquinol methylase
MKLETERDASDWVNAASALAVASAWNALGLFEKLRAGPVARSELTGDRRALDATIPVLAHVGILDIDGERVALSSSGARLLARGGLPTMRNLVFLADLAKMSEVLKDGGPVRDASGNRKATRGGTVDDPVETERFLDMLYRLSEEAAASTFAWLAPELPAKARVLDLGGGHGRYARAFADGGHEVTLFDQPAVVGLAKKRHGDALAYLAGDFHTAETFGGPYDLILLCNVVHGESDAANASIIARAAKSLRPGGRVAIRDMFLDEHGAYPRSAAFFGITMLFYTEHGTSPTVAAAREWLEKAGLGDVRLTAHETHQMVVGRNRK